MTGFSDGPLIAGVELGGTKIICLLGSGPDDIREQVRLPTTTPAESLEAIRRILERWKAGSGFAALGIASFGPLELDDRSDRFGQIVSTTKPGWDGADLNTLGESLGVPVKIDTDVNGAALAEGRWGAAQGLRSYAYITVGTGVGVGSIVSGQPVRGAGHSEAGHLRVGRLTGDVWPGVCRFHGDCIEGLASGPAIEARTGRPGSTLSQDDRAWEMVVHALGGLLHNLVLTTVPERILIGGGVADGQAWLFPRVRKALAESLNNYGAMDRTLSRIDDFVQPPQLGGLAGPLGAVALGCLAAGV